MALPKTSPCALSLTVAVIGHRPNRLPSDSQPRIRDELFSLVADLSAAATRHGAGDGMAVLTSLAEGADRLGAEAAIAQGLPLHVVLPLERADYEADFADDASRADFRGKLAAASRMIEPGSGAADGQDRDEAYELAADILLDHADLLIAVWDEGASAGRGGTTATVEEASARAMPVIVIDARGRRKPRLIWRGLDFGIAESATVGLGPEHPADQALEDVVRRLLTPPRDLSGTPVKILRDRVASGKAGEDGIETAHEAADDFAGTSVKYYRRAIKLNFVLAFLAITLAVIGLAFLHALPAELKRGLLALETAFLGLIVAVTWIGRRKDWHRRWLVYREIAEYLRIGMTLRAVGMRALATDPADPNAVVWFVTERFRRAGLPSIRFDRDGLTRARDELLALASSQADYHQQARRRAHQAERSTERMGSTAFGGALAISVLSLALTFTASPSKDDAMLALGMAAIILPALGSALLGIRMFGDYAGVARRSGEAADFFAEMARRLRDDSLDLRHLRARALEIARFGEGDIRTWRLLAQNRPIDLPG